MDLFTRQLDILSIFAGSKDFKMMERANCETRCLSFSRTVSLCMEGWYPMNERREVIGRFSEKGKKQLCLEISDSQIKFQNSVYNAKILHL
uniref:Uncharacterized protein n=1 Tax=Romanomermis culicivorax TaxID=13658 RepID=A0A915KZV8_ROMCU